ncbi:MAG: phosphotransferase [Planctomycetaceae bacterium]|nr:phosphotransferase [Planctomycetaceae bacterium]
MLNLPVLSMFGITPVHAELASGGFSGTPVWKVVDGEGRCWALRRLSDHSDVIRRFNAIGRLQMWLRDQGLGFVPEPARPVRRLITGPSAGKNYSINGLVCVEDGRAWMMESWMSGNCLTSEPSSSQLRETLDRLRDLHDALKRYGERNPEPPWIQCQRDYSPGVLRRVQLVSALTSDRLRELEVRASQDQDAVFGSLTIRHIETLRRKLTVLRSRLTQVAEVTFSLQPVLRDLWRPHVLFEGSVLTGLIDWAAMDCDHVAFDVTRLLRSWFGSDNRRVAEALDLFARERSLSPEECQLLETLDMATVMLSPLTWVRRRYEEMALSVVTEDVRQRMEELVIIAEGYCEPA